jgi:PKD repeat protein
MSVASGQNAASSLTESSADTSSRIPTSSDEPMNVQQSSVLELTQDITLHPDNKTSFAPGQTYNFMIRNTVETPFFFELWKQKSVSNPTLKLNVTEATGPSPTITGVASPEEGYDAADTTLDTRTHTISKDEFDAGSVSQLMFSVKIPEDTEAFTISATTSRENGETIDDKLNRQFKIKPPESSTEQLANLADTRAESASDLYNQYDRVFNGSSVDEIVNRGMANTFFETTKFMNDIKSLHAGAGVFSKLKAIKSGAKQLSSYAESTQTEKKFDGPWVGPIIQVQNQMLSDGLDQTQLNAIKREGSSNFALKKLEQLANEEAKAWRNGERERALEFLRKQRDIVSARDYSTSVQGPEGESSNYNLLTEAQNQRSEAKEDPTLGDATSEGTVAYFTGVQKFSNSQYRLIDEVAIPMAQYPDPTAKLINKPTVRDQLATGETVTAKFSVSNNGGAAQRGYLSLVYPGDSLNLTNIKKIDNNDDGSDTPIVSNVTDGKVSTKDGDRESIAGTLTDIQEPYQAGETNTYNVTFKQPNENSGEVYITYRTAFSPIIEGTTDDDQFIRSPTDSQSGPQGWDVKNISGDAGDPDIKWNGTYPGDYASSAYEVISTDDGGYLIAGNTTDSSDNSDVFVVKVDQDGDIEWQNQVGGRIDDHASTAVQAHDGGYIVAGYKSMVGSGGNGLWIIKFDKGGDKLWQTSYGDSIDDRALDIVATNDGEYAIAGYTETVGNNQRDAWLMKINDRGVLKWNETYASEGYDYTEAAALVQTNDGGYALAGQTYDIPDFADAFVVKTDDEGDVQWKNTYGFVDFDDIDTLDANSYATDIVQTADGNYTFVGQFLGNRGAIGNLKSNGETGWWNVWNSYESDTIESFATTPDGGYILAQRSSNGEASILRKTDNKGKSEWKKQFKAQSTYDSTGRRIARDVITTRDGNYLFAGEYKSVDASTSSAWLTKTSGAAPTNQAPRLGEVNFSPSNISTGQTAKISVTNPRDPDGSIQSYDWDLDNDGSTERSVDTNTTSYTFETAGEFTVTVTATDDDGAKTSERQTINVNAPPSASFRFNPTRPEIGENTTLDGSYATDTDGSIQSYNWDIENNPSQTGISPTVSFDTAGEYNVTLTTTDNKGENTTRNKVLTVAPNNDPIAKTGTNRTISLDQAAVLSARDSSDPDGDTLTYNWKLLSQPEGSSVELEDNNGSLQTLRPTETGEYLVKLIVTDKHGATATDTIAIQTRQALEPQFDYTKQAVGENTTVQFTATTSSETSEIDSYRWDFDEDQTIETTTSSNQISYNYSQSGKYQVSLIIVRDDSSIDTTSQTIRISDVEEIDVDVDDLPGSGTADDPYLIANASELQAMEDDLDGYYELENNISGLETAQWNEGKGFDPIGGTNSAFNGKFDGAGYTISGLTINRPNDKYDVGLFAVVDNYVYKDAPGMVSNVSMTNVDVVGSRYTGAIVGDSRDEAIIKNVSASGNVNGTATVGGLVGDHDGRIQASSTTTSVNGGARVGGIAGVNDGGIITNVSASADLNGGGNTGGLVGTNDPTSQLANGISSGNVNGSFHVGGVVGKNLATVENTFSLASVTGDSSTGGVTGDSTDDATVIHSYWDEQAVGQDTSAGNATALSTNQMTGTAAKTNMTGFAFGNIWRTQPDGYPRLTVLTDSNDENEGADISITAAIDADNDGTINDTEILTAVDYWQERESVPQTDGEKIGDIEILELTELWRNNRAV